jgi:hypothetical protein
MPTTGPVAKMLLARIAAAENLDVSPIRKLEDPSWQLQASLTIDALGLHFAADRADLRGGKADVSAETPCAEFHNPLPRKRDYTTL